MVNRWSNDDPNQGSAFHELVVLPTIAPHLARPYHPPGTPAHAAVQARPPAPDTPATVPPGDAPAGGDDTAVEMDPEALVNSHEFFVHVTLEWTERVKTVRSSRPKKHNESKNTSDVVKVLALSRVQFVTAALAAHGYHNAYIPGPTSGPGMQISWTGLAGGKNRAPIVHDDADWNMTKVQLREQVRRTKGKLNAVCVTFDLDTMEGFRNRKRPLSPPGHHDTADLVELVQGTHVPSVDTFSPDQVALGRAIEDVKASWACEKHGVCFITKEAAHIELNRFRLGAFGAAVVAGQCLANGPPPAELLQAWSGPLSAASVTKVPRGRSGPGQAAVPSPAPPAAPTDTASLLLSAVVPMVTMMAQQTMASSKKRSRRHYSPPSSLPPSSPPPSSSPRQSSPPPAIEDELDVFLQAFARSKGIPENMIKTACDGLKAAHYSPDSISEITLAVDRLQELTGLPEGQIYSLRHFARVWCGKVDAKRAKLTH